VSCAPSSICSPLTLITFRAAWTAREFSSNSYSTSSTFRAKSCNSLCSSPEMSKQSGTYLEVIIQQFLIFQNDVCQPGKVRQQLWLCSLERHQFKWCII
jgi:hypothetical protein